MIDPRVKRKVRYSTVPFKIQIILFIIVGKGAWVNCGIKQEVRIDKDAPANTRVTVRFNDEQREDGRYLTGKLITPDQVREESGTYWGYRVRLATSIGKVRYISVNKGNTNLQYT